MRVVWTLGSPKQPRQFITMAMSGVAKTLINQRNNCAEHSVCFNLLPLTSNKMQAQEDKRLLRLLEDFISHSQQRSICPIRSIAFCQQAIRVIEISASHVAKLTRTLLPYFDWVMGTYIYRTHRKVTQYLYRSAQECVTSWGAWLQERQWYETDRCCIGKLRRRTWPWLCLSQHPGPAEWRQWKECLKRLR